MYFLMLAFLGEIEKMDKINFDQVQEIFKINVFRK